MISLESGKVVGTFPKDCTYVELYDNDKNPLVPCTFGGVPTKDGSHTDTGAKWGYCDLRGNIAIEPKFDVARQFNGEQAQVLVKDQSGTLQVGTIDRSGKWLQEPQLMQSKIDQGRTIANSTSESEHPKTWRDAPSTKLFQQILRQQNLIGMSLENLKAIFGEPRIETDTPLLPADVQNICSYDMEPGARYGSQILEFGLDKNVKVWGWRTRRHAVNPWVNEDVVTIDQERFMTLGNLIPKRQAAELLGATQPEPRSP